MEMEKTVKNCLVYLWGKTFYLDYELMDENKNKKPDSKLILKEFEEIWKIIKTGKTISKNNLKVFEPAIHGFDLDYKIKEINELLLEHGKFSTRHLDNVFNNNLIDLKPKNFVIKIINDVAKIDDLFPDRWMSFTIFSYDDLKKPNNILNLLQAYCQFGNYCIVSGFDNSIIKYVDTNSLADEKEVIINSNEINNKNSKIFKINKYDLDDCYQRIVKIIANR